MGSLYRHGYPAWDDDLLFYGNIDLANRPRVKNPDGSISTIRSIGIGVDGKQVLIPTVSDDGRIMSDSEAVMEFKKTGRHLGVFRSVGAANAYARILHDEQARAVGGELK